MRRPRWLLAAAALGLLTVHMVLLASAPPVVRRLDLHVPTWPAATPPLRLVLFSDLHVAQPGDSIAHLRRVVAQVNALHPDLVLIAGDFISNGALLTRPASTADAIAPLAGLRARLGTIGVLGNHDYLDQDAVRNALASSGVTLLDNTAGRRGALTILGISDAATGHDRVPATVAQARPLGGVTVALTHSPDAFLKLPPGIDLALAGHTHCGQIALPLVGPVVLGLRSGRRYACGIVDDGDRTAVVTAGLGTSNLPLRLGAAPDLWLIELGR